MTDKNAAFAEHTYVLTKRKRTANLELSVSFFVFQTSFIPILITVQEPSQRIVEGLRRHCFAQCNGIPSELER